MLGKGMSSNQEEVISTDMGGMKVIQKESRWKRSLKKLLLQHFNLILGGQFDLVNFNLQGREIFISGTF